MTFLFSEYLESCVGEFSNIPSNDHDFDYWPASQRFETKSENAVSTIVVDVTKQSVYEVTVYDIAHKYRPYRWINPDYKEAKINGLRDKGSDPLIAWDNVNWADTDSFSDILQKVDAIHHGVDFDTRVVIVLDIEDDLFLLLAKLAHERDITLNKLFEDAIRICIDSLDKEELS